MKKQSHLFIFLLFITTLNTVLPTASLAQQDRFVSLLPALQSLSRSQQEYTIDILSDGLGDLRTTANVKGLPAPEAVKRLCRGLPVKVKVHGRKITVQYDKRREVRKLKLNGEVQDIRAQAAHRCHRRVARCRQHSAAAGCSQASLVGQW